MEDGNIAFKVTYNDANWSGVCSKKVAEYNVGKRVWCKEQYFYEENCQSPCYADPNDLNSGFFPCFDAIAQKELMFSPGYFHNGANAGDPKQCKEAKVGKIALFTSKEQGAPEEERFIFAIGVIKAIELIPLENDLDEERIYCDKLKAIQFSSRFRPKYWDYYTNKNAPDTKFWGSGLFRYVDDNEIGNLLSAIDKAPFYNSSMKEKAQRLIKEFV
jgi:hypothetical protein